MDSIAKMKTRSPDIFIASHPLHNQTMAKRKKMDGKQNPFIDKTAWPVYLAQREDAVREAFGTTVG
jgi:hypothetical protein